MGLRSLLYWSALASIAWSPAGQQSGLPDPQVVREQTADQQVRQALNRLAFGPRPGDYERVRQMGVDAWIDQQLHPERIADPAVTQLVAQLPAYSADAL